MISPQNSGRAVHQARVVDAREVAPAHYKLKLYAPQLAVTAQPGQFVHMLTVPEATDWTFDPFLRRAFSIMSVDHEARQTFDILFRVEGRGTKALSKARQDECLDLIGPLGQPFDLSPFDLSPFDPSLLVDSSEEMFHVKHDKPQAIIVGGGVGVPPLVYLGQWLHRGGITVQSIIGARSSAEVIGYDELNAVCEEVNVTTDDGSRGSKGRVTDILADILKQRAEGKEAEGKEAEGNKPIIYACGPLPMLRAVAEMCAQFDVRCQVSLEENMPCGVGVCNGCVVRARQPFAEVAPLGNEQFEPNLNEVVGNEWSPYQSYRRVCVQGPACWADEIDWENN